MSVNFINRITIKKDGVYLSMRGAIADDNSYRSEKNFELSEIYERYGQFALDEAIIKALCSSAVLRGNHESLDKYYYVLPYAPKASLKANQIYDEHMKVINAVKEMLDDTDRKSLYSCNPTEIAQKYLDFENKIKNHMYSKLAELCEEYVKVQSNENTARETTQQNEIDITDNF